MDRMLLERCTPWIVATDEVNREAALDEYVDTVLGIIALDGINIRHRFDVREQALSTINVLVNKQGQGNPPLMNQETRMYMREQFLIRLTERLLDSKYGNSYRARNPEIDKRRTELRSTFQTVLDVDSSVFQTRSLPDASGLPQTAPRISAASPEGMQSPSRIQIQFQDPRIGRAFSEQLGKQARKKRWQVNISYTTSGSLLTLEIYPTNLGKIQRKGNPHDALRSVLQPIEDYLTANGCKPGSIITDDPRWLTTEWSVQ